MKTIRAAIEIAQAQEVVFDLTQNYAMNRPGFLGDLTF